MNPLNIIYKYYAPDSDLARLLTVHSTAVAGKALRCQKKRNIIADSEFIYEAAMLHDIGIIKCHAPGIFCNGSLPYICHGVEGRKMLENENLPRHAMVCERHTGAGISAVEIAEKNMPLPLRDMLPVSTEEKLICYADKFFSKSGNPKKEKSLAKIIVEMSRFGKESLSRFMKLHIMFGE